MGSNGMESPEELTCSPVRSRQQAAYRKAASFSGRPLTMDDIAEETMKDEDANQAVDADDTEDGVVWRRGLSGTRPSKSVSGVAGEACLNLQNGGSLTASSSRSNSVFSVDSEPDIRAENNGHGEILKHLHHASHEFVGSSLATSNRRVLGRKRSTTNQTSPNTVEAQTVASQQQQQPLKRVPSSLFYLQYDQVDEQSTKRRIPFTEIPTSRKFSAASLYSFASEDEDADEGREALEKLLASVEIAQQEEERRSRLEDARRLLENNETDRETLAQIDDIMKEFRLNDAIYRDVMELLELDMNRGLRKLTNHHATVKMYLTYVRSLPDGNETGQYLALDLGGTNFRVLLVQLNGTKSTDVTSKLYLVPSKIMTGPGTDLFDHIAKCILEFLDELNLADASIPLGFTFSFPCSQLSLNSARLVKWTKGFQCSDVQGRDVVALLQEALARNGNSRLRCVAIINDNVGVLMAGAHRDPNCCIGLILGTGTNCCYMERLHNVELWNDECNDPERDLYNPDQMVINTEWGAFGDDGALNFMRNRFDRELDSYSLNPNNQLFEKMISGMYMGEIVRLVLCELITRGLLFEGRRSGELFEPNRFYTKYISEIESDDPSGDFTKTRMVLEELNIADISTQDCFYVQHVCWQVSQRAAFLAATAVATVIRRLDLPSVTVAVDGSLYRFHPHFKDLMNKKISQLLDSRHRFRLILAHDGSGQGAALVAAVESERISAPCITFT